MKKSLTALIKKASRRIGLNTPEATYNPWKRDADFDDVFSAVKDFTLVDEYRCYELWQLVEQSSKVAEGALIEVGVWRGGTGTIIAEQSKRKGIDSPVYLCDTFRGVVKAGPQDSSYRGGEHSDTSLEIVEALVESRSHLDNIVLLPGIFPDDTAHLIQDQRFRFCHIDVDVYESAKGIFDWIWEKMAPGGIVVYDDYGFHSCDGIRKHVEELRMRSDLTLIHNLNGHAILVKLQ